MIGMQPHRDMTVGELRDLLEGYPSYWSVIPVVDGTKGILTAVREESTSADGMAVLIGEVDLPIHLQERAIHGGAQ